MAANGHDVLRVADGVVVVDLRGEHDLGNAQEVGQLLEKLSQANELVVVDLTNATFVDSSMLEALVHAAATAASSGATLRLQLGTASIVHTAFEVTGLLEHFDVAATRQEALAGFVDPDGARIPHAAS